MILSQGIVKKEYLALFLGILIGTLLRFLYGGGHSGKNK